MSGRPYGHRTARKIAQWYKEREENAAGAELEAAVETRKKTRLRLYECADCGKKLRVADDHLVAEHVHVDPETLAEARAPFILKTVQLEQLPF